jgi:hypothetical protein
MSSVASIHKVCTSSDIYFNDCLYESDDDETTDDILPIHNQIPNETCDPDKPQLLELKIDHNLTYSRPCNRQFLLQTNSCIVCRQSFLVQMQLDKHMREVHGDEFQIPEFITKGKYVLVVKNERNFSNTLMYSIFLLFSLTSQLFEMCLVSMKRNETDIRFLIRNNFFVPLLLNKVFYVCSNQYIPIDSNKTTALSINVGESFEFGLHRDMFTASNENHSILLVFEDEVEYIEHYQVTVSENI